ncbi:MAG: hypothetical protein ACREVO_20530 [Steroidobacteraceae bacterium]
MVKYRSDKRCGLLALALCIAAWWPAAALAAYPKMAPLAQYLAANRASEVALARSAVPKSIGDHASVLVLEKDGYATVVKGSNGFVCFVGRSWANDFDNDEFWNPRVRTPQCWNAVAASSLLQDYLNRTKWVLSGVSRDEMAARTKAAFSTHEIGPPAPGSVAYMLSKHQYINDATPAWHPHVMFFVPATDGTPWGANVPGGPLYSTTSSAEPVTTYFLVVPRWSDGTPGSYATDAAKPEKHHHG